MTLDRDKLARYAELYRELGGYPYDRDPGRPDWYPLVPNTDWADPGVSLEPSLNSHAPHAALTVAPDPSVDRDERRAARPQQ